MILSINQPAYLPWPGYFDRIDASDLHIILDHVQFEKNSHVNRNKVRTPTGWNWLTIPVATKGKFEDLPINELLIADKGKWCIKHWKTIQANYARAACFHDIADFLSEYYNKWKVTTQFIDPVLDLNNYLLSILSVTTETVRSTEINIAKCKSELVLDLCMKFNADTYLSGPFGRNYLDLENFKQAGVSVKFHDYQPKPYQQAWPGFEVGMSVIDLLANIGADNTKEIMISGRTLNIL